MRLVVAAIYLFLSFVALTWWVVMPTIAAFILSAGGLIMMLHIISTFSAIGRVVMLTGAMSELPIMPEDEEDKLNPYQLSDALIQRTRLARRMNVDVNRQYRFDYQELLRDVEEGRVQLPLSDSEFDVRAHRMMTMRKVHTPSRQIFSASVNDALEEELGYS